MNLKEYCQGLENVIINKEKSGRIFELYSDHLPEIIMKIISIAKETVFLDNGQRILSYNEIIDAEQDLHIPFREKGIIPIADCENNDFIVYNFKENYWSMYNISDETFFMKKASLNEYCI